MLLYRIEIGAGLAVLPFGNLLMLLYRIEIQGQRAFGEPGWPINATI